MITRLPLLLLTFSLYATSSWAVASLQLAEKNLQLEVKVDADQNPLTILEKDKSLWLVGTGEEAIAVDLSADLRKKYTVETVESLQVNGGSGVRLQFKDKPKYSLNVFQKPETSKPLSVVSLKEGLVLGADKSLKVLTAFSPLTGEALNVVPSSQQKNVQEKVYHGGVKQLATHLGYAFTSPENKAMRSLYQGGQQFLAMNAKNILKMTQKPTHPTVAPSIKEEVEKLAPIVAPVVVVKVPSEEKVKEPLTQLVQHILPITEGIQPITRPEVGRSLKKEELVIKTDDIDASKVERSKHFEKDNSAFDRAFEQIRQATQQLKSIHIPAKQVEENVDAQSKKMLRKKVVDNFSSFFGEETATKDDFKGSLDDDSMATTPLRTIWVEEGAVKNSKEHYEEPLALDMNMEDAFRVPDLAPEEPLFSQYVDMSSQGYQKEQARILSRLSQAPTERIRQLARLSLAKLYMVFQRPQEVIMALQNMPTYGREKQIRDTASRLLTGIAYVVINRPDDALPYLEKKGELYEDDRNLWLGVANEMLDKDDLALKIYSKFLDVANNYPPYLLKDVYLSYGRLLLRQERLSELKKLMQGMTARLKLVDIPPEAIMLLAKAAIIERDDKTAETLLAEAATSHNLEVSFLAQYEFVNFLLNRGDLGAKQAIEHLENLRFLWRGGELEEAVLFKLGRMYVAKGEQRKGLERLKSHNIYFTHSENIAEVTEVMTQTFTDLYLNKDIKSDLDPLALIGLYYDFRELTPAGEKGDKLIAQIGHRLRQVGLFDRAIKVLEHQLEYRVKDEKVKGKMGRDLAEVYYLNGQYKQSLVALNRTESNVLNGNLHEQRRYMEAQNLIALKRYDDALKAITGIKSDKASQMRAQVAWLQNKYQAVVKNYQPFYDNPQRLPSTWQEDEKVNFVRLAIAYNELGKVRDLQNLKQRFKNQLDEDKNITRVVNFLLKDRGADIIEADLGNKELWHRMTGAFDAYHNFSNYYDSVVEQRKQERREKDIFNRRMRQMSAPLK